MRILCRSKELYFFSTLLLHSTCSLSYSFVEESIDFREPQIDEQNEGCSNLESCLANSWQKNISSTQKQDINNTNRNTIGDRWRWKYIDEQHPDGFEFLVEGKKFEQRLADMVDLSNSLREFVVDTFTFDSGDEDTNKQQMLSAAGESVDDELCGQHLVELLLQMNELSEVTSNKQIPAEKHVRLARVLDSFAHYDSGLLAGRDIFLGSYHQCISSNLLLNSTASEDSTDLISTRYCIAKLDLKEHLSPSLRDRARVYHEKPPKIFAGICLPSSCHTRTAERYRSQLKQIVDSQFKLPKSIFTQENLPLHSIFCMIDEDSQLNQFSYSAILFFISTVTWLLLVCFSTYKYDIKQEKDSIDKPWLNHLIKSLSLNESWNDFMENQNSKQIESKQAKLRYSSINFDTINPVKVSACMVVVMGHSVLMVLMSSSDLSASNKKVEQDPWIYVFLSASLVVDTFFIITGILVCYLTLQRLLTRKIGTPKNFLVTWFLAAFTRIARLVPLYYLVFWFRKSIYIHLASGPLWDFGTNKVTLAGSCNQETWLSPINFHAAYTPLSKQCLPSTWSVANDLFASIFLTPIILLLSRKPKIAIALSLMLILLSSSMMLKGLLNIDESLRESFKEIRLYALIQLFHIAGLLYTAPQNRIFSSIIGFAAGYAMFKYNVCSSKMKKDNEEMSNLKQKPHQWPAWFKNGATNFAISFLIINLIAPPIVPILRPYVLNKYPIHHALFDFSMTIGRLIYAASSATILLRMMTDWKDSYWMRLFASKVWKVFAKLNYSILLIHVDVMFYFATSKVISGTYSGKQVIIETFASTFFVSACLGLILHVVFENPFNKLIKGFFEKR